MIVPKNLKAAREAAGLSQKSLAARVGLSQQAIGAMESGGVVGSPKLYKIAQVLGVPIEYLDPEMPPSGDPAKRLIPVVGYVGAGAEIFSIDDHLPGAGLEEIEPPHAGMHPDTVAVKVRGNSMEPAYFEGDVILYDRQEKADLAPLVGKECVIALKDGRMFIKILKRQPSGDWYLWSVNSEPVFGINVSWAAKVRWIQRA